MDTHSSLLTSNRKRILMFKQKQNVIAMLVLLALCGVALTAKGQAPIGSEIARAAKSIKLDRRNSTTAERDGLKVTVTPTKLDNVNTAQLEKGYIIAVIDVSGGPVPDRGRHNLFVAKLNGEWRAFLESNARVKEMKNYQVVASSGSERISRRPEVVVLPTCWCATQCWGTGLNAFCLIPRDCHRCD